MTTPGVSIRGRQGKVTADFPLLVEPTRYYHEYGSIAQVLGWDVVR